jgi:hypothetical protein
MPVAGAGVPWVGSLLWLANLTLAAFAVSWVAANVLRVRRTAYIGVLAVATTAFTVGYVWWLGTSAWTLLATRWIWGVVGAPFGAAFMAFGMTRLPVVQSLRGRKLAFTLGWEAVVYGVCEGVLLSALPAFMTWQLVHSLGWSGPGGLVARWSLPVAASIVVVVVHHLGYWEYRNRLLVPISGGCGLLTVAYLVTANPVTAALGHVIAHTSALLHGADLPPHPHSSPHVSLAATELPARRDA